MIRCGVIGFGKVGKIRAKAIEKSGVAKVVSVYDISLDQHCPYSLACTADSIIHDPSVDAVFICTPNYLIPKYCIDALNAGKHVFAEKPPGFNAKQVEEVLLAEEKSGRNLMYGFNHRHHESINTMKHIVDAGELGKILWMRGRYGKEVDPTYFKGWRANPKMAGAGILLDQGIHMADLMLYFGGNFDHVHAFVSNLFWKIDGIEDNVFAIFRNSETGVCASLHSTMTQWRYLFSLEIFLEKGALILNGIKTTSGVYGDEVLTVKRNFEGVQDGRFEADTQTIYHVDNSWQSEVNHFFNSIISNKKILQGSSKDALNVMRLIDSIYQHNQTS